MATHVLKNFKFTKSKIEEFRVIEFLNSEDVILELPLAVHEFNQIFEYPIIFGAISGVPLVQEAETVIEKTRMFHFKQGEIDPETKNSSVVETSEKEATVHIRLPKDTKVNELILINGQVFWAQKVEKPSE